MELSRPEAKATPAPLLTVGTRTSDSLSMLSLPLLGDGKTEIYFPFTFALFIFQDRVTLCSPGSPGTHSVDQGGLELPASASQVLGLKACTITAWLPIHFL